MKLKYSNIPCRVHGQKIHPQDVEDGEEFVLFNSELKHPEPMVYKRVGNDIYHRQGNGWIHNTTNWFCYPYRDYQDVYLYVS